MRRQHLSAFITVFFTSVFLNWFVLFILLVGGKLMKVRIVLPRSLVFTSVKPQVLCSGVKADVQLHISWFKRDLSRMCVWLPEESNQTTQRSSWSETTVISPP